MSEEHRWENESEWRKYTLQGIDRLNDQISDLSKAVRKEHQVLHSRITKNSENLEFLKAWNKMLVILFTAGAGGIVATIFFFIRNGVGK